MTKVRPPSKPKPPARDASLPRPFFDMDTRVLMDEAKVLTSQIKALQAKMKPLFEERLEMWWELERRDVSYRAMARHMGLSTPTVSRAVKQKRKNLTAPIV